MIYLTRRETFNAGHRMFRPEWDNEKNFAIFGKCSNPNWHGHNYELFVTIKGEPNPETGYVINLKDLSQLIKQIVIEEVDHKNLNLDVEFLRGQIPSTENLVIAIWKLLQPAIENLGAKLHSIRIKETENNFVECFGD